jgi:hypothetical protein
VVLIILAEKKVVWPMEVEKARRRLVMAIRARRPTGASFARPWHATGIGGSGIWWPDKGHPIHAWVCSLVDKFHVQPNKALWISYSFKKQK